MEHYKIVVSGYGEKDKTTVGYYTLTQSGVVKEEKYSGHEHPSFVLHAKGYLVTLEETSQSAVVNTWKQEGERLAKIGTMTVPGADLCHLSYSKKWAMIVGACYGTGDVFALRLQEDGSLQMLSTLKQEGDSEGVSRAHCMQFDQGENYVYGVNIATDKVICYKANEDGINPNEEFNKISLPKDSGPRHIQWHPHLPVAYVITEYSNEIYVLKQDVVSGEMALMQTISCVEAPTKPTYGATVCIDQKGTTLYAANRGMDSITRMTIQEDGRLVYEEETSCHGCWPRHIALTQDDQYLLVANQKSGDVSIIKISRESKRLENLIDRISFEKVSFVDEL